MNSALTDLLKPFAPIPRGFIRYWLPQIGPRNFAVLAVICEAVFYDKTNFNGSTFHPIRLSYNDIEERTGLKRHTVIDAIKDLQSYNIIIASTGTGQTKSAFEVMFNIAKIESLDAARSAKNAPLKKKLVVQKTYPRGAKNAPLNEVSGAKNAPQTGPYPLYIKNSYKELLKKESGMSILDKEKYHHAYVQWYRDFRTWNADWVQWVKKGGDPDEYERRRPRPVEPVQPPGVQPPQLDSRTLEVIEDDTALGGAVDAVLVGIRTKSHIAKKGKV